MKKTDMQTLTKRSGKMDKEQKDALMRLIRKFPVPNSDSTIDDVERVWGVSFFNFYYLNY